MSEGTSLPKTPRWMEKNDECLIYFDTQTLSLQKCLITKTMAVVLHPTYLPYLAPCHFFLFPRRKSELLWQHLESWNSGKIADCPTNNSEKSVWAVLPAVTEMLVTMHKLRRGLHWSLQEWPIIKPNKHIYCYWPREVTFRYTFVYSLYDRQSNCVCHRGFFSGRLVQKECSSDHNILMNWICRCNC
jgi:hypothetical protein